MFNQKDIIAQTIKILNNKDITIINNENDEDYMFSALTVEGGGVFKKGISIGIQEKMVPGLLMYDTENFYGFSEKYGLSLLSTHPEYTELELPEHIFNKGERNRIQPSSKSNTDNFHDLKDTEKIENKNLNIDLQIKDTNNFYIIIPKNYGDNKFILTFNIKYIYDLNSIISNMSLVFINNSNKIAYFKIINDNFYYEDEFTDTIDINSINKIHLEIISSEYFILSKKIFKKN